MTVTGQEELSKEPGRLGHANFEAWKQKVGLPSSFPTLPPTRQVSRVSSYYCRAASLRAIMSSALTRDVTFVVFGPGQGCTVVAQQLDALASQGPSSERVIPVAISLPRGTKIHPHIGDEIEHLTLQRLVIPDLARFLQGPAFDDITGFSGPPSNREAYLSKLRSKLGPYSADVDSGGEGRGPERCQFPLKDFLARLVPLRVRLVLLIDLSSRAGDSTVLSTVADVKDLRETVFPTGSVSEVYLCSAQHATRIKGVWHRSSATIVWPPYDSREFLEVLWANYAPGPERQTRNGLYAVGITPDLLQGIDLNSISLSAASSRLEGALVSLMDCEWREVFARMAALASGQRPTR